MNLIKILYMDWFVLPMAVYISFGPVFLFYRGFDSTDRKKFLKRMSKIIIILFLLFYIVVPVPKSIQGDYIKGINNLVDNNNDVSLNNIKLAQSKYCQLPYVSALVYFQFKHAYLNDFEDTFQRQNGVLGSSISDDSIAPASEICKTNFM